MPISTWLLLVLCSVVAPAAAAAETEANSVAQQLVACRAQCRENPHHRCKAECREKFLIGPPSSPHPLESPSPPPLASHPLPWSPCGSPPTASPSPSPIPPPSSSPSSSPSPSQAASTRPTLAPAAGSHLAAATSTTDADSQIDSASETPHDGASPEAGASSSTAGKDARGTETGDGASDGGTSAHFSSRLSSRQLLAVGLALMGLGLVMVGGGLLCCAYTKRSTSRVGHAAEASDAPLGGEVAGGVSYDVEEAKQAHSRAPLRGPKRGKNRWLKLGDEAVVAEGAAEEGFAEEAEEEAEEMTEAAAEAAEAAEAAAVVSVAAEAAVAAELEEAAESRELAVTDASGIDVVNGRARADDDGGVELSSQGQGGEGGDRGAWALSSSGQWGAASSVEANVHTRACTGSNATSESGPPVTLVVPPTELPPTTLVPPVPNSPLHSERDPSASERVDHQGSGAGAETNGQLAGTTTLHGVPVVEESGGAAPSSSRGAAPVSAEDDELAYLGF